MPLLLRLYSWTKKRKDIATLKWERDRAIKRAQYWEHNYRTLFTLYRKING